MPERNRESEASAFLDHFTHLMGEPESIQPMDTKTPNEPPIHAFFWPDFPEPKLTTAITYGLSLGKHKDWKFGRPELMVTVESDSRDWGLAAAYFVREFRGELAFRYQTLLTLETPISDDSGMTGFVVFGNPVFRDGECRIEVGELPINVVGLYPIYTDEAALLQKVGLERFWNEGDWDPFDVRRPDRSKLKW